MIITGQCDIKTPFLSSETVEDATGKNAVKPLLTELYPGQ